MPNLPRVVLFQYYAFDAGVFEPEYFYALKDRIDQDRRLWLQTCTGSIRTPATLVEEHLLLNTFYRFDNGNLYPEFRDLSRTQHYALPTFSLSGSPYSRSDRPVDICLTLHRSGVGTLVFYPPDFVDCPDEALKAIAVEFHKARLGITPTIELVQLAAPLGIQIPGKASLDEMMIFYLRVFLGVALIQRNAIDPEADDPLAVSKVNLYQLISVEDVPKDYDDIDDFVKAHHAALVDTAQAFSWHAKPEYSYSASRRSQLVAKHFSPDTSARRHLVYEMNSFRLVAVSALHSHPEIYGYRDNRWYKSFLGMIALGLSQLQVVYLLHGELWKRLQSKDQLLNLQEESYEALLDFHNARVINHPRGRQFLRKLNTALYVDEYYDVVRDRLSLAQAIASERHATQERRRADGFQVVSYLLSLIFSLQFADVFFKYFLQGVLKDEILSSLQSTIIEGVVVFLLWVVVVGLCVAVYRRMTKTNRPGK